MRKSFGLALLILLLGAFPVQAGDFSPVASSALTAFSPDGSKFLYADVREGELFLYDFGLKTAKKIVTLRSGEGKEQSMQIFSPLWLPEKDEILFASQSGQIWSVKTDGSEFHALIKVLFKPGFQPLETPNFLSVFPDGRLLFFDYDPKAKSQTLETVDAKGQNRNSFVWHKGILTYEWAPNRSYLAYLAETPASAEGAGKPANVDLWVTRADGGQLKKATASVYHAKDFRFAPVSWSDDSQTLAFFSEQVDEKSNVYRELHVQNPQKGMDRLVGKTWGVPASSLYWDSDGERLSYLEADQAGFTKVQLVTVEFKVKNRSIVDVRDITRLDLPDGSVLLGWDPSDGKNLYVLSPRKGKQGASYALFRQRWNKAHAEELLHHIRARILYHFERNRHRLIFCGEEGGCLLVDTPSGRSEWILPNFHSAVRAGDFQMEMGEYAEAESIYASINEKGLERDHFLSLETRRYLVFLLSGRKDKAKAKWDQLLASIDKGETQPADYAVVAGTFAQVREHGQALDMYKKTMDEYPASPEAKEALLKSGFIYRELKEYEFAKNCFGNFARLYPKDKRATDSLVELGETFLAKEEPGKAIKVFRKVASVAKTEEQRLRAFLGKARALEKMNLFSDAAKTYHMILDAKQERNGVHRKYVEEASAALTRLEGT